jgi:hypothetical protein
MQTLPLPCYLRCHRSAATSAANICRPVASLIAACCDAAASATATTALPLLPHCCHAASIALPLPLLLSCLSTHNKVNEWAFINPMTQYNNQQKTMF